MNIEEAIKHCIEVSYPCAPDEKMSECQKEHLQLAEWLKELLAYRATNLTPEEVAQLWKDLNMARPCKVCAHSAGLDKLVEPPCSECNRIVKQNWKWRGWEGAR